MNNNTMLSQYRADAAFEAALKSLHYWKGQEKDFIDTYGHAYHRDFHDMEVLAEQYAALTARQSCESTMTWRYDVPEARIAKAYRRIAKLKDEIESTDWLWEQATDRVEWFEERMRCIRHEIEDQEAIIASV